MEFEIIPGIKGCKIDDGCIVFSGQKDSSGYGRIDRVVNGKRRHFKAHRLVLESKLNRPIKQGYVCCHTCDNRACINPNHLWEGTVAQNNADMMLKGRHRCGLNFCDDDIMLKIGKNTQFKSGKPAPTRKLSEQQVRLIKLMLIDGVSKKEIARRFNIDPRAVRYIAKGERYSEVTL